MSARTICPVESMSHHVQIWFLNVARPLHSFNASGGTDMAPLIAASSFSNNVPVLSHTQEQTYALSMCPRKDQTQKGKTATHTDVPPVVGATSKYQSTKYN
ncbi:unnamed protein product [Ectocarpus fasciculatus]